MDILDKNKYVEFAHILSGCRTITDAYFFAEIYIKGNPEMNTLIYSMINGKRYEQVLDLKTIKSTLDVTNEHKYKDDAYEYGENQIQKTNDTVQKKTFSRIIKDKPVKPQELIKQKTIELSYENTVSTINKNCPHCAYACNAPIDTKYIICGYANSHTGYDWKGCGKDWCFECGKMLCKSWDANQLFLESNRIHNMDCCNHHSTTMSYNYIQQYCQCLNKNVNRNIKKSTII
jgi:hypothetical protein